MEVGLFVPPSPVGSFHGRNGRLGAELWPDECWLIGKKGGGRGREVGWTRRREGGEEGR